VPATLLNLQQENRLHIIRRQFEHEFGLEASEHTFIKPIRKKVEGRISFQQFKHTKAEKFKVKRAVKCWQPVSCKIQLAQWLINCQPALQNLGGPWSCLQYGFLRSHYFHFQDATAVLLFLALSTFLQNIHGVRIYRSRTGKPRYSHFTTHT